MLSSSFGCPNKYAVVLSFYDVNIILLWGLFVSGIQTNEKKAAATAASNKKNYCGSNCSHKKRHLFLLLFHCQRCRSLGAVMAKKIFQRERFYLPWQNAK